MLRFIVLLLLAFNAWAGEPPLKIGPEIFMLEGDEGDVVSPQITLANPSRHAIPVRLEAVNWALDKKGRRVFDPPEEQLEDCRGWWQAGFADLLIQPGKAVNHAVDIHIPEELEEERECRFALVVKPRAGEEADSATYIPLYLNVDGAEPEVEFQGFAIEKEDTYKNAMVVVKNTGTAHARVFGMLRGSDAQGEEVDLVVKTTEVLPGETRGVPLLVSKKHGGRAWWSPPVSVEGTLIWGDDDMEIEGVLQ